MHRIKQTRRRLGLSQVELAEAAGISPATVVEVELGHRQPQGRTLRKLATALGVEVADLLEEMPDPKAPAPLPPEVSGHPEAAEARRIAEGIKLPPSLDSLNIVPLIQDVVLAGRRREEQWSARAAESGVGQTIYGSVTREFERHLEEHLRAHLGDFLEEEQLQDFYSSLMYSGLLNSVRRIIDLEEENTRLKEENVLLQEQLRERVTSE